MDMMKSVAAALACGVCVMAVATPAQAQTREYRIPAGSLKSALDAYTRQSDRQVIYKVEDVRRARSSGASGNISAEAALAAVLAGTRFKAQGDSSGALAIVRNNTAGSPPASSGSRDTPSSGGASVATREAAEDIVAEDIVVTGSRIARTGYSQPTPVNVISAQAIEQTGFSNVSDILNRTPQVGVGLGSANSFFNGDAGASFINLRGLGIDRTLVLVNGRRRVSGTDLSSAVDLSTIPANMIGRIEVITGGAAAVYGADAVTGVVNITLKQDVDGLELSARSGISSRGDAASRSVGLLFGAPVADDRGSFTLGISYNKEDPLRANQRGFGLLQVDTFGNPANTGPNDGIFDSIAVPNYRFPGTSYGGAFVVGGTRYTFDGGLRPTRNDATPFGPLGFLGIGGDGFNDADFAPLRNESRVVAALAHFDYKIADSIEFFADFQFANTKTVANLQPTFDFDLVVRRTNPLLPASVAALMDANGVSSITVGRTNLDQGISQRFVDRDTWTIVSGLEGDLGERFRWLGFYQYGRYKATAVRTNDRIESRFDEALDVVAGPGGGAICASATARAAGCQPLAILGPTAASQAAIDYFRYDQSRTVINTQEVAGLQLTGKPIDLPAGPVSIAVGVEYRKEALDTREDGFASQGLLFNNTGPSTSADFNVKEAFGELLIPILADQPFAKLLSFEGAARYSDYNTIGGTFAWKLGGQYAPVEDLRFRVTYSNSVRAPNLNELFSPGSTSGAFLLDPCDATRTNLNPNRAANCAALGIPANFTDPRAGETKDIRSGGNPDLNAETSRSWTVGVVATPRFLPGLSLSVDGFRINIKGAIAGVPLQSIVDGCVDGANTDNAFCSLITRRADRAIGTVNVTDINIGRLSAEGVDFQANYSADVGDVLFGEPTRLRLALAGTYLIKNELLVNSNDPSSLDVNDGEIDNPKWRVNVTPGIAAGPFTFDWTVRFIDKTKVNALASSEGRSDNNVKSRIYNDLYASLAVTPDVKFYGGVNNLFDTDPPFSALTFQGTGRGALFDNIGRYFFVGATAQF